VKRPTYEDWWLIALVICMILLAFWVSSCTTQKEASSMTYSSGCYLRFDGISIEEATELKNEFELNGDDCVVTHTEELKKTGVRGND
jgi:hypothetical protein